MGRVVCTQPQGSCFLAYNICCYQSIRNQILHAGIKQLEIIKYINLHIKASQLLKIHNKLFSLLIIWQKKILSRSLHQYSRHSDYVIISLSIYLSGIMFLKMKQEIKHIKIHEWWVQFCFILQNSIIPLNDSGTCKHIKIMIDYSNTYGVLLSTLWNITYSNVCV